MLFQCAVQIQMPGVGFLWIPESGTSILVLCNFCSRKIIYYGEYILDYLVL